MTCETHGLKNCPSCSKQQRGKMAQIICEVGQNHCGDMKLARQLISLAKEKGGDLAKFQLYDHKMLYKDHPEIPDVELTFDQAKMLFNFGQQIGIEVFFSVFDIGRVKWCEEIGVKRYKLACGFVHWASGQNIDLGKAIIKTEKEIIISYSRQIYDPLAYQNIKKLYCIPNYPALIADVHFGNIDFNVMDGFSDHTIGLDAAKIALSRGARIIEKHFAIDHNRGVDAQWSMTSNELAELVRFSKVVREVL